MTTRSSRTRCSSERVRHATPVGKVRSIAIHAEAGVDERQFLMATETVPHDRVMSSIEMFGEYVILELKRRSG
jgi:hypothetical protein